VAGRRSVWSDPRLAVAARDFVAATDEVWRLQRYDDRECRFFRTCVAGRPEPVSGSWQGIYIIAPSGEVLARRNSLSADRVLELIALGLERWRALPEEKRQAADPERYLPRFRWEDSRPQGGLILETLQRELEGEEGSFTVRRGPFNRDHVWYAKDEARAWLPAQPHEGQRFGVPDRLARRLARFHLIDNVRGQEGPFAPEDIRSVEIEGVIDHLDDEKIRVRFSGKTDLRSDGVWRMGDNEWKYFPNRPRGMRTEMVGVARWNVAEGAFDSFQIVAIGEAWGSSGLNGRRAAEESPQAVAHLITLAPEKESGWLPPAFIDAYDATWLRRPEQPAPSVPGESPAIDRIPTGGAEERAKGTPSETSREPQGPSETLLTAPSPCYPPTLVTCL